VSGLVIVLDVCQRLPVPVLHDEASVVMVFDSPGRREAMGHQVSVAEPGAWWLRRRKSLCLSVINAGMSRMKCTGDAGSFVMLPAIRRALCSASLIMGKHGKRFRRHPCVEACNDFRYLYGARRDSKPDPPDSQFWRSANGVSRESRSSAVIPGSSILVRRAVSITRTAAPARRLSECHDPHSWSVVDESRKLVRACRMAELLECLRFNLTNALAGHAEFFSDFFKGMIGCAADAETHAQDALLPRC
jgi:hypothetical protein